MYKYFYITAFLVFGLIPSGLFAQYSSEALGGRASGIGNASVTLNDAWSLFNNVGALGTVDQWTTLFAYENRYGMETGLPGMMAAVVMPMQWGVPALSFYRFGGKLFNEQHLSLSFGHEIGTGSFGIKGNLVQYKIKNAGVRRLVVAEVGGVLELLPALQLGAHIYNINQAQLSKFNEEMVPVTMKTGIAYHPTGKLLIAVGVLKSIRYKPSFQTGLEYQVLKFQQNGLFLRSGVSSNPVVNHFGLGFEHALMKVDYGLNYRNPLGPSHQLSIGIPVNFTKNNN